MSGARAQRTPQRAILGRNEVTPCRCLRVIEDVVRVRVSGVESEIGVAYPSKSKRRTRTFAHVEELRFLAATRVCEEQWKSPFLRKSADKNSRHLPLLLNSKLIKHRGQNRAFWPSLLADGGPP